MFGVKYEFCYSFIKFVFNNFFSANRLHPLEPN